ncbi:hypothetical protein CBL_05707 [Carabus blaptoides fortunei]
MEPRGVRVHTTPSHIPTTGPPPILQLRDCIAAPGLDPGDALLVGQSVFVARGCTELVSWSRVAEAEVFGRSHPRWRTRLAAPMCILQALDALYSSFLMKELAWLIRTSRMIGTFIRFTKPHLDLSHCCKRKYNLSATGRDAIYALGKPFNNNNYHRASQCGIDVVQCAANGLTSSSVKVSERTCVAYFACNRRLIVGRLRDAHIHNVKYDVNGTPNIIRGIPLPPCKL